MVIEKKQNPPKQNRNHMKFWLIDVRRSCPLYERGEERELIGLLAQGNETWFLPWLHRTEQCQWDFGLILCSCFHEAKMSCAGKMVLERVWLISNGILAEFTSKSK